MAAEYPKDQEPQRRGRPEAQPEERIEKANEILIRSRVLLARLMGWSVEEIELGSRPLPNASAHAYVAMRLIAGRYHDPLFVTDRNIEPALPYLDRRVISFIGLRHQDNQITLGVQRRLLKVDNSKAPITEEWVRQAIVEDLQADVWLHSSDDGPQIGNYTTDPVHPYKGREVAAVPVALACAIDDCRPASGEGSSDTPLLTHFDKLLRQLEEAKPIPPISLK